MGEFIRIILTLTAMAYLMTQPRKPGRWIGRFFVWMMNRSHSALTDWGLQHVQIGKQSQVLDIGCGGGRTIQKLAALATEGRVCGVDFADGSVAGSRALNADLIAAGRVEIQQASVSDLPYEANAFDLVTAVETHYYWPDLVQDLRGILRVIKPGGVLCIIAEVYRSGAKNVISQLAMMPLGGKVLSAAEHREAFSSVGFMDVQVFEEPKHGWICVTVRKGA